MQGWYRKEAKVPCESNGCHEDLCHTSSKMLVACVLELVEIVLPATAHSSASMLKCRGQLSSG